MINEDNLIERVLNKHSYSINKLKACSKDTGITYNIENKKVGWHNKDVVILSKEDNNTYGIEIEEGLER